MSIVVQILLLSLIIAFLHELGHYVLLKIFKIPIYGVGLSIHPIPHFYIRYKWPKNKIIHCLVILSGSATTILEFIILILFVNYHVAKIIFIAYYFQFIYETNPFFSDYVFAYVICKNKTGKSQVSLDNYYSLIKSHMFGFAWYIHFVLWSALIISLILFTDLRDIYNL